MKTKKLLYFAVSFAFAVQGFAQENKIAKADKQYENYAFVDAIAIYERVAEKGYKDEKMFQKLGNAYYFKAELPKAVKWYDELFAMNPEQEPEYYYRYSQSLKSIGNYDKADKMLEKFSVKSNNDKRAKLFQDQKNYLEAIKANSGRYEIADAGINSEYSDYGSSFFDSKLVFASARDTIGVSRKVFKWTNESFTNLYSVEVTSDGVSGKPERFARNVNSKFHESTPVFTKDGKTMYFTRNNYLDGKRGRDAGKITLLKVYKATQKDGKWTDVEELPFNSNEYSVAHPALSLDEKTLYFASNMTGTIGQSDLFQVAIKEDGTYGTPVNLGPEINTEGRETFPFISEDNKLYFASDGRPGLGGLDVFVADKRSDNSFYMIQNVGEPVNSKQDDFGYIIDSKTSTGFFTSNREGGKGYDDIYKFKELKKLTCTQVLSGIVTDQETGQIVPGAKVSLLDRNFKLLKETIADEKGFYSFDVNCGETYYVRTDKEEYQTEEGKVVIPETSGKTEHSLQIEKRIKPIEVGTDLAKILDMPIIYFDLDKSFIRKDAAFELEKILAVMQQYPKMRIDVRSHTDSRQTHKYNEKLSESRAKSSIAWLVQNGIQTDRLTGKGYGETQLVNKCADGVKCTETEHQANRRSEFVILSIE